MRFYQNCRFGLNLKSLYLRLDQSSTSSFYRQRWTQHGGAELTRRRLVFDVVDRSRHGGWLYRHGRPESTRRMIILDAADRSRCSGGLYTMWQTGVDAAYDFTWCGRLGSMRRRIVLDAANWSRRGEPESTRRMIILDAPVGKSL
jgi:hypothetical protein